MLDVHAPIQAYVKQREALGALLESRDSAGLTLARKHADVADAMLQALFAAALRRRPPGCGPDVLLAAVGGYGRQQLGWKSDLDVMFVTMTDTAELEDFVEAVLYPLWDAGVAIGHQVMRVDHLIDTAREALPTATALLDFRPLVGSARIGEQLRERSARELFCPEGRALFVERLVREVEERWRRYGDSVYLLEPDVKNGAGGLRDVDVACWTARASASRPELADLSRSDVLTTREVELLAAAANFFFCVRNHLHHAAARRNDRLTFDQQENVAQRMGYRASLPPMAASEPDWIGPTVEAFMSDYYVQARAVTRAQEQVLERAMERAKSALARAKPRVKVIERGIIAYNRQLGFAREQELEQEPAIALRLYALAVDRNERVLPAARDAISRLVAEDPHFCAALRRSPEAAQLFIKLLCTVSSQVPFRNGSVLEELHSVGLLLALIPEFAPVIGRVHHDLYHVYTVDVHSVACVDRVRALMRGELMQRHALGCRLAAEAHRPQRLLFAALLHDIGKVFGGKEHSMRGAAMARSILARFGLESDDVERVTKLVLHHLDMYFVAARRDLADSSTIEQFAQLVGDRDCLRNLYLLTIADISTTAPTSMTSWKARMLDELYAATDERLAGVDDCDPLRRARSELYAHTDSSLERGVVDELVRSMPERYLLTHTPDEIAAHARCVQAARGKRLHVQLAPSRRPNIAELCVITGAATQDDGLGDRPGLLAAIAAALTACKLEIYAAQIYTRDRATPQEQVLDVFWVRDPVHGLNGLTELLPKLEQTLLELISGAVRPDELLQKRNPTRWSERPCPRVPVEIAIDNRSSQKYTIVEVVAQDRPGLLFSLAHTLHRLELSIEFAKVNTEGNRVIDIFYVTELDETKLASRARLEQLRAALFAALGRQASN